MLIIQLQAIRRLPISAIGVNWISRTCANYSRTILLPKTEFPLRINAKKRVERDLWIANEASFEKLYQWQRNEVRDEEFILHDGPPYANGNPHMGHALNKILKDITNRYHLLSGKKIHYTPGWDCHGLPIELKALESAKKALVSKPTDIRQRAKSFASNTIKTQKAAFQRWGVMADWENNCYYTFQPHYITCQLQAFFKMYEKGLVFRDYKPVYWSPSSKTALAESELEYNPAHKSTSIYLKLALQNPLPPAFGVNSADSVYVVVWTTTPWTLPANQAICFDATKNYSLVRTNHDGTQQYWIIASELAETLRQTWSIPLEAVSEFRGEALKGIHYAHPLRKSEMLPLLAADHVTITKGTGFVHTAPAHGPEDFLVALQNQIPVRSLVDEEGRYNDETGCGLIGLEVLGQGQEEVLKLVRDDVVHRETFVHSYPYDWRTKLPVILRASLQWFIDTDAIKHRALEVMKDVTVVPPNLEKAMLNQLASRPYWCISRQRSWGVPIPVFYHNDSRPKEAIVNKEIIDRLCTLVSQEGSDLWWERSADDLIGNDLLKQLGLEPGQLQKGQDIMDIWFDSGVSWNSVLPAGKPADLYLEGIDQFGGWFQSSLLTSVALTDRAPYKKLFVHGFALDAEGRKMSKSLGNVVDPKDIVDGDGKKQPAYGADVLRWWTASHVTGNGSNVPVGSSLIQQAAEDVQKMRAVFRFILGNLQGISDVDLNQLSVTDRYMLHLLSDFVSNALKAFEEMNYKKVVSLSQPFINTQISAYYCQIVKDRLYCHAIDTSTRRNAVFVLNEVLKHVTLILAPLLPHLTEEVYLYHPQRGQDGLFRNGKLSPLPIFRCPEAVEWMRPALAVREAVNQLVGAVSTKDWHVNVVANPHDYEILQKFQMEETSVDSDLCELLQVSGVTLQSAALCSASTDAFNAKKVQIHQSGPMDIKLSKSQLKACPRCRRFTSVDGSLCPCCVRMIS